MDRYLTLNQLADYANRSERSLRDLIRRGELQSFRATPRGRILVRISWYDAYVDTRIEEMRKVCAEVDRQVSELAEQWLNEMREDAA